jgi:hypothetical protein
MQFPSVLFRLLAFALCSGATAAATEFTTTVPEDLLREFTGGTALSDLPEGFPPFVMPEGISPIGSQQTPGQQMVLLRTGRDGAESQLAVANALRAVEGSWMELVPLSSARQNGFVVPARTREPVTLCHDQHGIFEILGEDGIENRVYIRRSNMVNNSRSPTCAEQNESRITRLPTVRPGISPAMQYRPSFEALIPPAQRAAADDTTIRNNALGVPPLNEPALGIRGVPASRIVRTPDRSLFPRPSGLGGVGLADVRDAWQSNAYIPHGDRSLRAFNREVADLMEELGWEFDSGWNNADAAASHWVRESNEGNRLLLRLYIARIPADFYNIEYELGELGN